MIVVPNTAIEQRYRQCSRASGLPKRPYHRRHDAKLALAQMRTHGVSTPGSIVYRCPQCRKYHIGSPNKVAA